MQKAHFFCKKQTPNRQKTFKVLFSILYTTIFRRNKPKTTQKRLKGTSNNCLGLENLSKTK